MLWEKENRRVCWANKQRVYHYAMTALLKPSRLAMDLNSPAAAKHWRRTFMNFIEDCGERAPNKFRTLVNYVYHNFYYYWGLPRRWQLSSTQLYVKMPNEIFSRHLLATRRQRPGETLTEFLQELRKGSLAEIELLDQSCARGGMGVVSDKGLVRVAEQYHEEMIRDSFINAIASPLIQQRFLENKQLDLRMAFDQANALNLAEKSICITWYSYTTAAMATFQTEKHDEVAASSDPFLAATYRRSASSVEVLCT